MNLAIPTEAEVTIEKRFAEVNANMDKRFAEHDAKMEKILAEQHGSLLRWMFAFFIGNAITSLGFLYIFMQLVNKP